MCPHLAGICAVGFGVSVSAANVGPIWRPSLCPQNSRSWEPFSTWMRRDLEAARYAAHLGDAADPLIAGAMQLFFPLVTLLGLDRERGDRARFQAL